MDVDLSLRVVSLRHGPHAGSHVIQSIRTVVLRDPIAVPGLSDALPQVSSTAELATQLPLPKDVDGSVTVDGSCVLVHGDSDGRVARGDQHWRRPRIAARIIVALEIMIETLARLALCVAIRIHGQGER